MSFVKCIRNAVESGRIKPEKGDEAVKAYEAEYERQKKAGLTDEEANTAAALASTERLTKEKGLATQRRLLEMRRSWENQQAVDKVDVKRLPEFTERFMDETVQARYETRLGQFQALIEPILHKYRPRIAGIRRPVKGVDNIVREIYGEGSNDKTAKHFAAALREAVDSAVKYANRAGADIDRSPDWRMPQMQSAAKMSKKKDQWMAQHMEWLDWDRMKHFNSGEPILPENRAKVLDYVYDTLVTSGAVRVKPGQRGARSVTDRLSNKRFLYYKDADSWLAANKAFGDGNAISQFVAYIDSMARDTAVIDVFGPNAEAGRAYVAGAIKQKAGIAGAAAQSNKPSSAIENSLNKFEESYRTFMGVNAASQDNWFANTAQSVRNLVTSAFLGSTAIAAVAGDMAKAMHRGAWTKTAPGKFLEYYSKNVFSQMTRREAVRAGLIAENAMSIAMGQVRFTADFGGYKWSQYISDVVMRASFLSPHTQVAKWASAMELMGVMADSAKKGFDNLSFKTLLEDNGITAEDWDLFRTTAVHDPKGLHILRPEDMRVRADIDENKAIEVADKFMDMIHRERKRRVIESSLRAQATLRSDTKAGTLPGELLRSVSHLKNFPVTIFYQILEDMADREGFGEKAAYFTTMFAALTFGGALSLQLQQVTSGRDPLAMNTPQFWGAAALKGGGLGVMGDFLFADTNRYGDGFGKKLLGPSVEFATDMQKLTIGNLQELAAGEDTDFWKEFTNTGARYAPGSSIWWAKLMLRRKLTEKMMEWSDPKAHSKFRQIERKALKDYGQEYWWSPGDETADRGPDWSAAFGE